MKKISLGKKAIKHRGMFALVDDEDFEEIDRYNWCAQRSKTTKSYYAVRAICKKGHPQKLISMHRQIMGARKGEYVGHVSYDTLDNRRGNLRIATCAQNQGKRAPLKGGTSRFKGVCWNKALKGWQAQLESYGRKMHLGIFKKEEDAARAYDAAALANSGEFAYLNFPKKEEK